MYYLEINGKITKHEYEEVKDITPWFNIAIAHGAQNATMWLRREEGDCHVIAKYPINKIWATHNSIKRWQRETTQWRLKLNE